MELVTIVNRVQVTIDLAGVTDADYAAVRTQLDSLLAVPTVKNRDAIKDAFIHALRTCPTANASDLWHHVVYRIYCELLPRFRPQDPKQSWVRASGDALEATLQEWYAPFLTPHGVQIAALTNSAMKRAALQSMGILDRVGAAKLDVTLSMLMDDGAWHIFGGVHVKASLAERVSDDIPASRAMMQAGYFSPLWTLDVKSFPPPHGNLVNRGELGTPDRQSEKRRYIENHGDSDACYSANGRTVPSSSPTPSGKRIFTISPSQQPDQFVRDTVTRTEQWVRRAETRPPL